MKKPLSLLLMVVIIISLSACTGNVIPQKVIAEYESKIMDTIALSEEEGLQTLRVIHEQGKWAITVYFNYPIDRETFSSFVIDLTPKIKSIVLESDYELGDLDFVLKTGDELLASWCTTDFLTGKYMDFINSAKSVDDLSLEDLEASVNPPSAAEKLEELKSEFCIEAFSCSKPNSAGGVDVNFSFSSLVRPIKYIDLWITPYNGVDDTVSCEITGKSQVVLRYTGPSGTDDISEFNCENAWYNKEIKDISLDRIKIEFMDGTTIETKNTSDLASAALAFANSAN